MLPRQQGLKERIQTAISKPKESNFFSTRRKRKLRGLGSVLVGKNGGNMLRKGKKCS